MRKGGRLVKLGCRIALMVCAFFAVSLSAAVPAHAQLAMPVATDSRIKTFVYSENDVYNIVTHYGYQSNIEFGLKEEIETISLGDRVPFQVIPAGRRLFIRAMTANARTNMTVVTNEHTYQFDITAVPAPEKADEALVYVVRFYYPQEGKNVATSEYTPMPVAPPPVAPPAPVALAPIASAPPPAPPAASEHVFATLPAAPVAAAPVAMSLQRAIAPAPYNYKYTFSGSNAMAPLRIFDDGKSTYFKLHEAENVAVTAIDNTGKETAPMVHDMGDYLVVSTVSPRFMLTRGAESVMVYNETLSLQ